MKKKELPGFGISGKTILSATGAAFSKLDPRVEIKNPVMFVVWVGSLLCTIIAGVQWIAGLPPTSFTAQVIAWLWFTLLFANFAEGVAEAQGKARADSLRSMRNAITAHLLGGGGKTKDVKSSELRSGDLVVCETGDLIPGDGEVVEGVASVDESAITGE